MKLEVSDTATTQTSCVLSFLLIYLDCHHITLEETTIYFLFRGDALNDQKNDYCILKTLMITMVNSNYRNFNY